MLCIEVAPYAISPMSIWQTLSSTTVIDMLCAKLEYSESSSVGTFVYSALRQ